jgi:glutamate formiminotransferase
MKIYESVPNISEGQDKTIIEALINAVRAVPNIRVLDYSSDIDHNRSVFTYIGAEKAIIQANLALVKKASELLDVNRHQGVHPRLGVVDVMPIVPVWEATMPDAVEISYKIGQKLEKELHIPAYYYEFSAKEPKYRNLADIRRYGYNSSPVVKHKTAGAVCLGARDFLVAYNVNLNSDDLAAAKAIAAAMREDKSGFVGVKALGLRLVSQHCVQVSMNVTEPTETPLEKIYQRVEELAKGAGMTVKTQEVIGVLPLKVIREAQKLSAEIDEQIKMLQEKKEEHNDQNN